MMIVIVANNQTGQVHTDMEGIADIQQARKLLMALVDQIDEQAKPASRLIVPPTVVPRDVLPNGVIPVVQEPPRNGC
jgi:hypothetical protein